MANVRHSRNLFTRHDGGPMCFSLIPCAERKEIREMIEYGGGMLMQPGVNPQAIKLVPTVSTTAAADSNERIFSTEFVRECAKRDLLLPLRNFSVDVSRSSSEDVQDESETMCQPGALRSIRVRREFSLGEDISIAKFMAKERGLVRGNAIYKRLERSGTAGKHTWQSLKERYLKKIYPMRHLFESPACDQPRGPRANGRVDGCGTPVHSRDETLESPSQRSQDVQNSSSSMVATPSVAIDVEEPVVSTCSSQAVPETDYDALCDTSSCPQDSPGEFGTTQPFVPMLSGTTDDIPHGKLPVRQVAVQDRNSTEPFVPRLSWEGSISPKSPLQAPDNTPSCEFDGSTEPFVVTSSGEEAKEVAPQSDSSEAPDNSSSETVIIETPADSSSERSGVFRHSAAVRSTSSMQSPYLQRDGHWPSLSNLCDSPGDLELLQGRVAERSSQNAPGTLGDPQLASFTDFPSDSQFDQLTSVPNAQTFTEDSSYASLGVSQSRHGRCTRTGIVSGQRRLPSSAKDSEEQDFSLKKGNTHCSRASLVQSSRIPGSGCCTGLEPTSDRTVVSSDEYETATSKSGSPLRSAVGSLLDLLVSDPSLSPKPKVKVVRPIILSKLQHHSQCSQQVPAGHKDWSPSLLDNRDCEMETEAPQLSVKLDSVMSSDMSMTLGAQAGEIWDRSRDGGQPGSPCRLVRQRMSSAETMLEQEDSEMECEQPGPSGTMLPCGATVAPSAGDDSDSCDSAIVRKQKTGRPVRAMVIVSSDDDEDAAPKRPRRLDKGMLEQHQRNLQLMVDAKKRIENKWHKQRRHKRCPSDCSCPQSPYYAALLRLLVRTRAILAFHNSLDADSRACATALMSELVER
ncbi:unnamed protein product, partial [Ixodes hexagonus]